MVGAKSLGCSTCKRRRVKVGTKYLSSSNPTLGGSNQWEKCDERRPICGNCEKKNRPYTGPKSRFVRHVEPGVEQHIKDDNVAVSKNPSNAQTELLAIDPMSKLSGFKENGYQLQLLWRFLPSRVGHNAALDAALRCLLHAHRQLLSRNSITIKEDLESYDQAFGLYPQEIGSPSMQDWFRDSMCFYGELNYGDLFSFRILSNNVLGSFQLSLYVYTDSDILQIGMFVVDFCFRRVGIWYVTEL
jgi:hypothetical protein